jgi:type I restriction enzyme S subunit
MSFGRPYILKITTCIHDGWIAIRKISNKTFEDYLYYFISSESSQSYFQTNAAGAAVKNLNAEIIKLLPIYLPKNKKEQQKIASCLSSLDEVIAAHSQKLDLLKNHKKGMMQNLFPQEGEKVPKYRFKEFENDGEWVAKTLGKICDVRDGTHDSPIYVSKGYPMITSKNLLINGMIDFDNVSYLSEDDYSHINKRSKVDIDDILFGMIGTIGNPVIVKNDGFAIKNVALIKSSGKLNQEFLLHQLKSNYILTQFEKVNAGGILKFIALGVIRNLTVIVPLPKEQQKIASCLSSLDALITAQAEKIEQLKLHKKGLMQGLFPKIEI